MVQDDSLDQAFVRVTEKAALAAAQTMRLGEREESDRVAVEAMRETMGGLDIAGWPVIVEV